MWAAGTKKDKLYSFYIWRLWNKHRSLVTVNLCPFNVDYSYIVVPYLFGVNSRDRQKQSVVG